MLLVVNILVGIDLQSKHLCIIYNSRNTVLITAL